MARDIFYRIFFVLTLFAGISCIRQKEILEAPGFLGWATGGIDHSYGRIFMTGNDGFNWINLNNVSELNGVELYGIAALNSNELFAAGGVCKEYALILHSTDGGTSWNRQGLQKELAGVTLHCIKSNYASVVYTCGEQSSLLYTKDGGQNWNKILIDSTISISFISMAFNRNNEFMIIGNKPGQGSLSICNAVFYSPDGVTDFRQLKVDSAYKGNFEDIQFMKDSLVFITAGRYIYRSNDKGSSWEKVYDGMDLNLHGLSHDSLGVIWACGDYGTVIHSNDSGLNWLIARPYNLNLPLYHIAVAGTNRIWVSGGLQKQGQRAVMLYSRNKGSSWFQQDIKLLVPVYSFFFAFQNK